VASKTNVFRLPQNYEVLAHLVSSKNSYIVKPELPNSLWIIVKSLENPGHLMKQGDVLKIGRMVVKVRDLKTESSEELNTQESSEEDWEMEVPNEREEGSCRLCCSDDNTESNPLIAPCKCSGSVKYIHLQCLQKWLMYRATKRCGENCSTYQWKSADCEICKTAYPVKMYDTSQDLFSLNEVSKPYVVLEVVNRENTNTKGLYVVSLFNKCEAVIGRGHESDIRISDISVSRSHAKIKLVDGNFVLSDNESKFGTLVSAEEIQVNEKQVDLQLGRSVVSFSSEVFFDSEL